MDTALTIPVSDAMRRPGYTISKDSTGIEVSRASLSADRCMTESLLYVWRAIWATSWLRCYLLQQSGDYIFFPYCR